MLHSYRWIVCALALIAVTQRSASASQELASQAQSLFDPASPQAVPEVTFAGAPSRQLQPATRKRALPRPPRTARPPATVSESNLLDTLVPLGTVMLKSRSTGQEIFIDDNTITIDTPTVEKLHFPLSIAAVVSSPFGQRANPLTGENSFHRGVDLVAPEGTPVLAAYSGMVLAAGPLGSLGNAVVLAHGDRRRSRYGHLLEVLVKPGEFVQRGTVIGRVGSTGRVTGPHLHFEYWTKSATATWEAQDTTASFAR